MRKIGFIGLGIMGKPMALNVLKAGYSVCVLASSHSADEVKQAGATVCSSKKEMAAAVEIMITMLPDSPEVETVLNGTDGLLSVMKAGQLFIDMSTISPLVAKKIYEQMKAKGIEALDAPVSGGQVGAEAATLSIMVGGDASTFEKALPVFQAMGKNIVHMGEAGAGQITKACNQIIVGMTIQAVAEAFTLANKAGVDLARVREVLLGGFAHSKILDLHGKRIMERNFKPGFKIKLHKKDLDIALAAGEQYHMSMLGTSQVAAQMKRAIAAGNGELDHSSLVKLLDDSIK